MTAILYSEGPRDLGASGPFDTHGADNDGPLAHLIRDVLGHPDGLLIETRKLGRLHGSRETHGLSGFGKKVYRAIRDAERDRDDGIVVVVDRDGDKNASRLENLKQGRERARREDRERNRRSLPCAIGVAQEMVESWLMGDAGAWQRAFGLPTPPDTLPQNPETETGAGSSPRHAKKILEDLLRQADAPRNAQGYGELARHTDTAALEERCHRSFRPFADELRRELGPSYGQSPR